MQKTKVEGYRLSPQQRRLWELRMQGDGTARMLYCIFTVDGGVELERLRAAAEAVVGRYEILRTTFVQMPGMEFPLQVVNEAATICWDSCDAAGLTSKAASLLLEHTLTQAVARPFTYEESSPLGAYVVKNYNEGQDVIILGL